MLPKAFSLDNLKVMQGRKYGRCANTQFNTYIDTDTYNNTYVYHTISHYKNN